MNNNFKKTLESAPYYIKYYGFWEGTRIVLKFLFGKPEQVALKDIKEKIYLRKGTSDAPTFHQIFAHREYGLKMLDIKPKTIIDAGANIGLFSVFIKNKFPDAKIVAIEPDKDNYQMVLKNTEKYDDISVINCGLWNKSTMLKVYDKYNSGKWGMVVEETSDTSDPQAVWSISIGDIIEKYGFTSVDLLKIDIETAEKYLFDESCKSWLPKVKVIAIELHDWIEPGCAQPFLNAINTVFKKYAYYIKGELTIIVNETID